MEKLNQLNSRNDKNKLQEFVDRFNKYIKDAFMSKHEKQKLEDLKRYHDVQYYSNLSQEQIKEIYKIDKLDWLEQIKEISKTKQLIDDVLKNWHSIKTYSTDQDWIYLWRSLKIIDWEILFRPLSKMLMFSTEQTKRLNEVLSNIK